MLGTILIVILILAIVGALPKMAAQPGVGFLSDRRPRVVLLIVPVLLLLGRI